MSTKLRADPYDCQAVEVVPFQQHQHAIKISITASAHTSWKLKATYLNRVTTSWRTNALGETYGVPNDRGSPYLVAVPFISGNRVATGYVKATDLACAEGHDETPAQALARQKVLQGTSIAVPVYKSDGATKIGQSSFLHQIFTHPVLELT